MIAASRAHPAAALGLIACLLLGSACGGEQATEDRSATRSVRVYISQDPSSLSMLAKTDLNAQIFAVQLTDSLVQYNAALELQPRLAESYEFSPDRLTLTFRLRAGIRWHDGRPVTADDVVFTANKVREPAVQNPLWAPRLQDLVAVEAVDDRTVRVRYSVATPDALEAWILPILPRHLAGADESLLGGKFEQSPVGCGPFRFVRYLRGREIVLEANDDYWDGRPQIDRLILKIYPDQRTGYQALLTGDLDLMKVTSSVLTSWRESDRTSALEDHLYHGFSTWVQTWNQDGSNPFFTDPRVRRAMVLSLDRERFNAQVLQGLTRPGATTYHPDTVWADPEVHPWPYDPAEAARLLDEAGWVDADGDGMRERDGREFSFELLYANSNQQVVDQIAAWQQQSWADLGIRAELVKLEWQAFRARRNARLFDAASYTLKFTPNPDQYELYHSSMREGGINYFSLNDPEVDRLVELGRTTFGLDSRLEVYHQLQRRLHEIEAVTCLFYFGTPVLHDPRLSGVRFSALGFLTISEGPRVWRWGEGS